jgi:hypothetical protein
MAGSKPRAAAPAKKPLRAAFAGARGGSQHVQRKNVRRLQLALIPSSRFV